MEFKTQAEAEADMNKWWSKLPNEGKGWTSRVWSNCGWYWSAENGPISVHGCHDHFFALIATTVEESGHGAAAWSGETDADTPTGAVDKAVQNFREYAELERNRLSAMEAFLKEAGL